MVVAELAPPRIQHVPDYTLTRGQEAIDLAASAGLHLDAHQQLVLLGGCAESESGKWQNFEVGLCEPRQNGKGAVLEALEITAACVWNVGLVIHSAHQFDTSQEHFRRLLFLIEDTPELDRMVKRVSRSHGEEGIEFTNGSRIRFRTRTKGGGRGFSCDLLALDEAMFLPESVHGALLPTMRARPNPQVWYTGSAVDQEIHEHGIVFARVRERGIAGDSDSLAYYEWSLEYEHPQEVPDEVAASEEAWAASNAALGIRIFPEHVQHEYESMDSRTFAVEILGVGDWPRTDGRADTAIAPERWASCEDRMSQLVGPVCFAFDVSPDRQASIAAAGKREDGRWHVEVFERQRGTAWLPGRVAELADAHDPRMIVCDGLGPSASLLQALDLAGVKVQKLTGAEHAQACGRLVDQVNEDNIRHTGSLPLWNAVRGSATRPLGDAWAWSRKSSTVDISPLVAVTLALYAAMGQVDDGEDPVIY